MKNHITSAMLGGALLLAHSSVVHATPFTWEENSYLSMEITGFLDGDGTYSVLLRTPTGLASGVPTTPATPLQPGQELFPAGQTDQGPGSITITPSTNTHLKGKGPGQHDNSPEFGCPNNCIPYFSFESPFNIEIGEEEATFFEGDYSLTSSFGEVTIDYSDLPGSVPVGYSYTEFFDGEGSGFIPFHGFPFASLVPSGAAFPPFIPGPITYDNIEVITTVSDIGSEYIEFSVQEATGLYEQQLTWWDATTSNIGTIDGPIFAGTGAGVVPLPTTLALLGIGLAGLGAARRRLI